MLGWTLYLSGKTQEAIEYLQKAFDLRTELLGSDDKRTLLVKERLDSALETAGSVES